MSARVLLLLLACVLSGTCIGIGRGAAASDYAPSACPLLPDPAFRPVFEEIQGTGTGPGTFYISQIPASPKAVLVISHGLNRSPYTFWDRHPDCALCTGLPEDRAIALEALGRGYALVAVKSIGVEWETWPFQESRDRANVEAALGSWLLRNPQLRGLPLVGLGVSAGGNFSSALALDLEFAGLVFMVASGSFEALEQVNGLPYPPTMFIHMPKDPWEDTVQLAMDLMRRRGVEVVEVVCNEFPVAPDLFTTRVPCVSQQTGEAIHQALAESGLLDERDLLKRDPRLGDSWKEILRQRHILPDCAPNELCLQSHLLEELNIAWASHAITSLPSKRMFDWLDAQVERKRDSHSSLSFVEAL